MLKLQRSVVIQLISCEEQIFTPERTIKSSLKFENHILTNLDFN